MVWSYPFHHNTVLPTMSKSQFDIFYSEEVGEAKDISGDVSEQIGMLADNLAKIGENMTDAEVQVAINYYNSIVGLNGSSDILSDLRYTFFPIAS